MPTKRPSVAERVRLFAAGGAGCRRAFSRRRPGVRLRRGSAAVRAARRRARARRRCMAGAFSSAASEPEHIVTGGDDGRRRKPTPPQRRGRRNRRQAALDRSRRARAGRHCGLVGQQGGVRRPRATASRAMSRYPRRWAGRLRAQGMGSPSPIKTHDAVVGTPPRQSRNGWNERSRTSPRSSAPIPASSSPPCRSRRCTAGGLRRQAHADVGYTAKVRSISSSANGRPRDIGSRELNRFAVPGQGRAVGTQPAMLAPLNWLVTAVPAIPAPTSSRSATRTAPCPGAAPDGAEILARRPNGNLVSAFAWNAGGTRLAFATETGDAGRGGAGHRFPSPSSGKKTKITRHDLAEERHRRRHAALSVRRRQGFHEPRVVERAVQERLDRVAVRELQSGIGWSGRGPAAGRTTGCRHLEEPRQAPAGRPQPVELPGSGTDGELDDVGIAQTVA